MTGPTTCDMLTLVVHNSVSSLRSVQQCPTAALAVPAMTGPAGGRSAASGSSSKDTVLTAFLPGDPGGAVRDCGSKSSACSTCSAIRSAFLQGGQDAVYSSLSTCYCLMQPCPGLALPA